MLKPDNRLQCVGVFRVLFSWSLKHCAALPGRKSTPSLLKSVSRPNRASLLGQSGCSFVEVCLASGSSSFALVIASAIDWLLYLSSIWALVSQSRAPCELVVDLSINLLYRLLFFHSPAQLIHSSRSSCNFSVPKWPHWNPNRNGISGDDN